MSAWGHSRLLQSRRIKAIATIFIAETTDKDSCKREPRQSKGALLSSVLYVWVHPVIRDAARGKIRCPAPGGREFCVTGDR